jgi:DNA-binding FadR family transcriptional regulator
VGDQTVPPSVDVSSEFSPDIRQIHLRLADQLGLAIMRGTFAEGQVLPSESKLCEMMGVSRTAMREAIRGLVAKGLVESRSKVGTRVRPAENWNHLDADVLRWRLQVTDTDTYLHKTFQLREATEPAAAAIAAGSADATDHERIAAAFEQMVAAGSSNQLWVEADLKFHTAIYLATHNEFFWPIGQLVNLSLRELFTIAARGSHRPRAIVEHRELMEAIIGGKPELAREISLRMVQNASGDVAKIRLSEDAQVPHINSRTDN